MTALVRPCGEVWGTAGFGVSRQANWQQASRAGVEAGRMGEILTAKVLDQLCLQPGGPTVIHDVRIPLKGINANIDHVLVAGDRILLIDSKCWKPGVYWTLFGQTRRGTQRFLPAEKKTMQMARQGIDGMLRGAGARFQLATPLLVVWPSNHSGSFTPLHLQVPGARTVAGVSLERVARRFAGHGDNKPSPLVLGRLLALANDPQVKVAV